MLLTLLTFLLPTTSIDYKVHYGDAYQEALEWVEEREQWVEQKAQLYQWEKEVLLAIVFPELLRYSQWQDLMETEALGVAYVEGGTAWADFSIGSWQMKPSFVEKLEEKLQLGDAWAQTFHHLLPNGQQDLEQQRRARLERLQTLAGQLDYLAAFCGYMRQRPGFLLVAHTPERLVRLLATAYNSGMEQDWVALEAASYRQFFPYGARYPQEGQQAYANIAVDYYQNSAEKVVSWHPLLLPYWRPNTTL